MSACLRQSPISPLMESGARSAFQLCGVSTEDWYRKACSWPFARQDAKECESRDHCGYRLGDSYSPFRHWCFQSPSVLQSPSKSVGPGLRTDV
jgi:hypothetical protein